MTVNTFLDLLKNVTDKNKPLVYARLYKTIYTVNRITTYHDTIYLYIGKPNKLNIRNIAVYLLNKESDFKVKVVTPIKESRDIKSISDTGFLAVQYV